MPQGYQTRWLTYHEITDYNDIRNLLIFFFHLLNTRNNTSWICFPAFDRFISERKWLPTVWNPERETGSILNVNHRRYRLSLHTDFLKKAGAEPLVHIFNTHTHTRWGVKNPPTTIFLTEICTNREGADCYLPKPPVKRSIFFTVLLV